MMSRYLIFLLILLIIYIFVTYFVYPHNTIRINQANIENFQFQLLYEKHPIIIQNHNPHHSEIVQKLFSQNFISNNIFNENTWYKNKHKYLIIYCQENKQVNICNPDTILSQNIPCEGTNIISINLQPTQFIILPYKWYVFVDSQNFIGIHDYFTYLVN